jgi:TonB-dependent receptor
MRDVVYRRSAQGQPLRYSWVSGADSGSHFYSSQDEDALGAGLDYTQPISLKETKLKFGGLLSSRERQFSARRFLFEADPNTSGAPPQGFELAQICDGEWRPECPDRLFRRQNIAPGGLILRETTQPFDGYRATLNVLAGYGQLDFEPIKRFRVIGGARVEHTRQLFSAFAPNGPGVTAAGSNIKQTDVLPALSMVLATTPKSNVRLGASRTIARPQLREMAPVRSVGSALDLPVRGNPELELTRITNLDLRFEAFPTLREVLAASVFYKRFRKPIEELLAESGGGSEISYGNAPSADLVGVELESRKTLDFLWASLKNFTLLANLTLVYSRVKFAGDFGEGETGKRPLSMQSPYIVNLSLDYASPDSGTDVRLLYNVFGPRITTVGTGGLPHVYEMPRHSVDLTIAQKLGKHFELKLSGQNLLHAAVEQRYRDVQGYRLEGGALAGSGEQNPIVRSYNPGTSVTLGATYTY